MEETTKAIKIRRPKITERSNAGHPAPSATSITVPEGQTLVVGSMVLGPGEYVLAAARIIGTGYFSTFSTCVGGGNAKTVSPAFQHWTKTGGPEDTAPISVSLGLYVTPVGPEVDAKKAFGERMKAEREEREKNPDAAKAKTGRGRLVNPNAPKVEWDL